MEKFLENKWFHAAIAALLAISILLAYSNTFTAAFQFDDLPNILENKDLKDMGNFIPVLVKSRGVTMASFMINFAVGGTNVAGYHVVNTAIHILTSVLVYFFLLGLLRTNGTGELKARWVAAFSSLFFALHPVQTQSITYIVQRMESLSSLFYVLGLFLFIKGAASEDRGRKIALYAGVALSYVLGFYSKEMAITLPAIVLLMDLFFIGKGFKGLLGRWPLYAVLAVLLAFFAVSTIKPGGGFGDLSKESAMADGNGGKTMTVDHQPASEESAGFKVTFITPHDYLLTQFNVLVYYVALLAVPVNQNLDYDFPKATSLFQTPVAQKGTALNIPMLPPVVSLAILLAMAGLALVLFLRSRGREGSAGRPISFFILWFFIILSPTSSFVPIIDVIYEHRLYLPSLGFFVIFVLLTDLFFRGLARKKNT